MNTSSVFRVLPDAPPPPQVVHAQGVNITLKNGDTVLDMTGGATSYAIVGWNHPQVNSALTEQISKFTHMDYKFWSDENTEKLASLLLSRAEHSLDRVYFCGNAGTEACEAAMKMSYQAHYDQGKTGKKWFISRTQSYHGATSDSLALGERPNLEFYRPMLSPYRAQIPMHHPLYLKRDDETLDEYAKRSAGELEEKILEIGPENVSGFVAETIMGGLIGNVPPAPNYLKYIKNICDKYDVHLILDEVYCGTGSSGKIYCCDWDQVTPDFIFIGKTLAAGYGVLSAVITSKKIQDIIAKGQGRLQHTTTFQAHSLSVAGALAVQKIVHDDAFLEHVNKTGNFISQTLIDEFGKRDFFKDVRGRGMRIAYEFNVDNQLAFCEKLTVNMLEKHKIYIDCKWHRINFTPSLILSRSQAEEAMEKLVSEFNHLLSE